MPGDVTVNDSDFRAYVNAASRQITGYESISSTVHRLELATPVFAVGDTILIVGREDVSGEAEYTVPAATDIVEVAEIDSIDFAVGTSEAVVIANLPTSVQVTLEDGTVRYLNIEDWSSDNYSSTAEGTYLFEGDLVLVHNVNNSQELKAQVEVEVSEAVVEGIVTDLSAVTLEINGTEYQVSSAATDPFRGLTVRQAKGAPYSGWESH